MLHILTHILKLSLSWRANHIIPIPQIFPWLPSAHSLKLFRAWTILHRLGLHQSWFSSPTTHGSHVIVQLFQTAFVSWTEDKTVSCLSAFASTLFKSWNAFITNCLISTPTLCFHMANSCASSSSYSDLTSFRKSLRFLLSPPESFEHKIVSYLSL